MDARTRALLVLPAALLLLGSVTVIRGTDGRDEIDGTDGSDRIEALGGHDLIRAGAGNDLVIGGPGNDTFDLGPGNDVILLRKGDGADKLLSGDATPGRTKIVRFDKSVMPADVTLERRVTNVLLIKYGRSDSLTVARHFELDGEGPYRIDAIEFAGGKRWNMDAIRRIVLRGDDRSQYIVGYAGSEKLSGYKGNDIVRGGIGNDVLFGGAGNDRLFGDDGDDTLVGGEGNDVLRGESGSDTYIYRPGDGMDTIQNFSLPTDVDVVKFVSHMRPEVKIERKGADLLLLVAGNGKAAGIQIAGFASNTQPIARIEFREGPPMLVSELLPLFPPKKPSAQKLNKIDARDPAWTSDGKLRGPANARTQSRPIGTPLDRIHKRKPSQTLETAPSP